MCVLCVLAPEPPVLHQQAPVLGRQLSGHRRATARESGIFQYGLTERHVLGHQCSVLPLSCLAILHHGLRLQEFKKETVTIDSLALCTIGCTFDHACMEQKQDVCDCELHLGALVFQPVLRLPGLKPDLCAKRTPCWLIWVVILLVCTA